MAECVKKMNLSPALKEWVDLIQKDREELLSHIDAQAKDLKAANESRDYWLKAAANEHIQVVAQAKRIEELERDLQKRKR